MRLRVHNAFWRTDYKLDDLIPLREVGWRDKPFTPGGQLDYDVRTEWDLDCPHCWAAEPHTWRVHDACIEEARIADGGCPPLEPALRIPYTTSPRMPPVSHVRRELRATHTYLKRIGALSAEHPWCDVRLQVCEDGAWHLRTGPSDYDQDHRGFWGAGALPRGRFDSLSMARGLIGQCADAAAEAASA